ncbi:mechanosensitive ion channel, partial [Clostridioides difficile]|nr:mechanosensitive ion channel [Clostridioides difficile]
MLSKTFGARGETVCRLLRSFTKYFSVIAMLYFCLALIGVDTKTLLASAGILTLVVGLGAKTLVSDILAGLFIIFEGEFRVGDIVTIGDWRGTVLEIGIRTTKIEDPSKNIKIISNSEVSGVINMTRQYSYSWADVGIEYGESLERVENILEKEFPNIRKRLPNIIEGPFYKGVIELGESSVVVRVMVLCTESDRV